MSVYTRRRAKILLRSSRFRPNFRSDAEFRKPRASWIVKYMKSREQIRGCARIGGRGQIGNGVAARGGSPKRNRARLREGGVQPPSFWERATLPCAFSGAKPNLPLRQVRDRGRVHGAFNGLILPLNFISFPWKESSLRVLQLSPLRPVAPYFRLGIYVINYQSVSTPSPPPLISGLQMELRTDLAGVSSKMQPWSGRFQEKWNMLSAMCILCIIHTCQVDL